MADLKPFNPDTTCPKCGGEDVSTDYHGSNPGSVTWCYRGDCMGPQTEHHERHCRRCHYEWVEGVLDAS